ncbi:heavy metal translocating P-type ATPase [Zongyangia hominis]|uniref:Cd(2+)-exporting ATPase n=1 Tax=Zongyangia hominis TaxID=2763677 RepID=A0A926EG31_9FIRM|nr:heavy metal translocating P-type ATPase [Zongyangia hominis]MBC8571047.1 cadmium-translocating P-type ATPase [Zongyangia hominis]
MKTNKKVLTDAAAECSCTALQASSHSREHQHIHEHDHSGEHGHVHDAGCELDEELCHIGGCPCCGGHEEEHDHGHEHEHSAGKWDVAVVILSTLLLGGYFLIPIPWLQAAAALCSILVAGAPIIWDGLKGVMKLRPDENFLMTVAVAAAFLIGEYPEAMLVTILFRLGNVLEGVAVGRSKRQIEAITAIRPEYANLLDESGAAREVKAREVPVGSLILIKAGEKVPLDCVVLEGASDVDTAALTGESVPRPAQPETKLMSGMINLNGSLKCRTLSTFEDSAASTIIKLVRESAAQKGTTEKFISRFATIYTPVVVLLAVLIALVPPLLNLGTFTTWLMRALVFLVASCPCAMVISIPLSFFSGIGAASKQGVLIKGSRFVESLSKLKCVVFDKTGTLTTGSLMVDQVTPFGVSEEEVMRLAALCESYSDHPVARAVCAYAPGMTGAVEATEEMPGKGIRVILEGSEVLCGSKKLMDDFGVDTAKAPEANVYVARDGVLLGAIILSDQLRPDAAATISALKAAGVEKVALLTGDGRNAALKAKAAAGLDEAFYELLPGDKVSHLAELARQYGATAFVGDGINDAPVLARADVGVAMGLGSDAAISAADVVLVSDRLGALESAVRLSKRTMSIATFNMIFAIAVKALVLILGALGYAAMWMAVFADVGVTVLCVLNAARILGAKS